MTHCDFSVRSARDEMRHIIGSSKPDVITSVKDERVNTVQEKPNFQRVLHAKCHG